MALIVKRKYLDEGMFPTELNLKEGDVVELIEVAFEWHMQKRMNNVGGILLQI